ncbi:MAG: tRNA uridine-5-carboxymethylaminomethyl(34) synthesis enzyme MnmG, partial [Cyclobacteriaceae bacterium]|nr:tRNA uridine-5-carboxymethylaminomethyl(34) synthesis enzyme MnmG [Cyclobacteriaceae bacterium]
LNYDLMEEQKGDENPGRFSFTKTPLPTKQLSCFITYTNPEVHAILEQGFDSSPMFTGRIKGIGPRYCPSIEDKINRFAERDRHQIFVEPEGWHTVEVYINGFSTSLPQEIQHQALRKIKGFEKAKMFRPGYAIEYDYFPPTQLYNTLETKSIHNLFFAGQINGTTGYEEAACQGLMAGINAHQRIHDKPPFVLNRNEAYIGVLIDDLINKGTEEPYRMFTSRAEYRILLRQDNADIRLTTKGKELGLIDDARYNSFQQKLLVINELDKSIKNLKFTPVEINPLLLKNNSSAIKEKTTLYNLLKRPELNLNHFVNVNEECNTLLHDADKDIVEQVEIQIKYEVYIDKQQHMADKLETMEDLKINPNFNFQKITALSAEARQKLSNIKPKTIGQASRISGVSPADISVLMVYMGR